MSGSVILMVSVSLMCVCYSDEWVGHSDGQSECDVYMLQWSVGRSHPGVSAALC